MNAKAFLKMCRYELAELASLRERQAFLRGTLLPAGLKPKAVDVQTSGNTDKMSKVVPEIVELDKAIDAQLERIRDRQIEAERLIGTVDDGRYRALLRWYYLHYPPLSWAQVADEMGYAESHILRMHGEALKKVKMIVNDSK